MAVALFAADPEVRNVKSVYILRMASGLDQLLASELAKQGVYIVTTDPQKADAIFTEALGEGFEKKYAELYPPPKEEKEEKEEEKEDTKKSAASGLDFPPRVNNSSWGARGRGTIFLVDRATRNLLWSMNRQPKNSSVEQMTRQARKIVDQLRKDIGQGQPAN
jgi:hypothetical protein